MAKATGYFSTRGVQVSQPRFASRWAGSRRSRRVALKVIFDELGCDTLRERRAILRELVRIHGRYLAMRETWDASPTKPELRRWLEAVAADVDQLAEQLGTKAAQAGLYIIATAIGTSPDELIVNMLSNPSEPLRARVAAAAKSAAGSIQSVRSAGRDPDVPFNTLIIALGQLYQLHTKRKATVGRKNDPYVDHVDGRPIGPFWRFIRAAFLLMGRPQGKRAKESIAKAIKRQQRHISS